MTDPVRAMIEQARRRQLSCCGDMPLDEMCDRCQGVVAAIAAVETPQAYSREEFERDRFGESGDRDR